MKDKKINFLWVKGALRMMSRHGLHLAVVVLGLIAVVLAAAWSVLWLGLAAFLVVAWLGAFAFFYGAAREEERDSHVRFVKSWIASARSREERSERQALYDNAGLFAAMSAAGYTAMSSAMPAGATINVDGTPMVPGSHLDIHGNPYGVTSAETGQFNQDTGGFVSESTSYNEPFGMK